MVLVSELLSANPRPDPDALLAEVQQRSVKQQRGRLKVFFGSNAGVGKTFAMLEEARKRAAEGLDVVVGYAEPHSRPETEAVLVGLEILSHRSVEYRGTTLKELDLDAVIARRPAICCVDELAHTNAPGMRHPKRWQDVAELLDAGISVYTTLNVQHLESVNDLVQRITGVQVRETLPDAIFDAADEVELIDIAPEELLERLRDGRIYKPEQAARARTHFFTKGNLIALRELALRKTAERVDEQMQEHRRDERVRQIVPASEKVLVCVGPSPLSARLVRSARRLASGLRAKLIAVSVEPEGVIGHSSADGLRVQSSLRLAEELGASIVTLTGRNIATEVLAYATKHNVTKIVIGKPAQPRWREWISGSVVDDLIRRSGEIDIYVIRGESENIEKSRSTDVIASKSSPDWLGYAIAAAVVAATTLIGWPLAHQLKIANANILMLYLLDVLWIATRRSRSAALLTSVLAVIAFDICFVPPYYTLAVSDRQYLIVFGVMLLAAFVISALTHRVRSQAEAARFRERRTAVMLSLSRDLAAAQSLSQIAWAAHQHVTDYFNTPSVVLTADSKDRRTLSPVSHVTLDGKELSVAQWAFEHDQPTGRGTNTLPAAAWTFFPIKGSRGVIGILGVSLAVDAPFTTEMRQLLEAFAAQISLAIERAQSSEDAKAAWEQVEAEFMRNTLLSGVSHELRTPLAGIAGAASTLAESDGSLTPDARKEMLDTLVGETRRMNRLISNLLDMTRMETGGLNLKREWVPIEEVIGATLHHLAHRLAGREVLTNVPKDLPMVEIDELAIEQVLSNLIDNAVEYTPPQSPIEISISTGAGSMRVVVADRGAGLPTGTENRVFEKFFRAGLPNGVRSRGIGLGLAISRAIVEAHGGKIEARNRTSGGAEFSFRLPMTGVPPTIDASTPFADR